MSPAAPDPVRQARRRVKVTLVVALALSLGSAGCSPAHPSRPVTWHARRPALPQPVSESEAIAALASSHVSVVEAPGATRPVAPVDRPGPLSLLRFQVRNLVGEANGNAGTRGAELDRLVPAPDGVPPLSYLVAAYITAAQSPGARLSRKIMGDRDWAHSPDLAFPGLVLELFVADTLTAPGDPGRGETTGAGYDDAPARAAPAQPAALRGITDDPCGTISNFVDAVLSRLFRTLTDNGLVNALPAWAQFLVHTAAGIAKGVIEGLADTLTAPVLTMLRTAIGLVGVATQAVSFLRAWHIEVTSDVEGGRRYGEIHYQVGDGPVPTGTITARVVAPGVGDWPEFLSRCAASLGTPLPALDKLVNAPVEWDVVAVRLGAASRMNADPVIGPDGTARFTFRTGQESTHAHETGYETAVPGYTFVVVHRTDVINKFRDMVTGIIVSGLPKIVDGAVRDLLGPSLAALTGELDRLTSIDGSLYDFSVTHHEEYSIPRSTPQDTCTPSGTVGGALAPGRYTGPLTIRYASPPGTTKTGGGSGTLELSVSPGGVTGSFSLDAEVTTVAAASTSTIRLHYSGRAVGTAGHWRLEGGFTEDGTITLSGAETPVHATGHVEYVAIVRSVDCAAAVVSFTLPDGGGQTGTDRSVAGEELRWTATRT
jgi:hypothetical protein